MRILGLILLMGLLAAGCATFNHSEMIDTDQQGYAGGRYASHSQGRTGTFQFAGIGGSGGVTGGIAGAIDTGPPKVTPVCFAKSIAMINYSRKLKSIKYDELGGIVEYQFDQNSSPQSSRYRLPTIDQSKLPSSFGYSPVE